MSDLPRLRKEILEEIKRRNLKRLNPTSRTYKAVERSFDKYSTFSTDSNIETQPNKPKRKYNLKVIIEYSIIVMFILGLINLYFQYN